MDLVAYKSSGAQKGAVMKPHKYKNGMYVASKSRFSSDYIYVESIDELASLLAIGYKIRMSIPDVKNVPSLIKPDSIRVETNEGELVKKVLSYLKELAKIDDMDFETRATSRREQAYLRKYLLDSGSAECTICSNKFDEELLVAAHIKMRSKCTNEERRDFGNVATLMCSFGCDILFERGIIGVIDGVVVQLDKSRRSAYVQSKIEKLLGGVVRNWHGSEKYYAWHCKDANLK